jgi:hypothetical protein
MLASVHKYVTNVMVVRTLGLLLLMTIAAGCAGGGQPQQVPLNIAVANELDAYGRLLRQENQPKRADEMAARAEKMRQAERERREAQQASREGRPAATSSYLGFQPDLILLEYAADLRGRGQAAEAERVEALGARYREEQTSAVNALVRGRPAAQSP